MLPSERRPSVAFCRLADSVYEVELPGPATMNVRRLDSQTLFARSPTLAALSARSERFTIAAPSLSAESFDALAAWLAHASAHEDGAKLVVALRELWHAAIVEARNCEAVQREALELRQLLTPERRTADGSATRAFSDWQEATFSGAETEAFARADERARAVLLPLFEPVLAACKRWRGLFSRSGGSPAELMQVSADLQLPELRLLAVGYMAAYCQPEPSVLIWLGAHLTAHAAAEVRRAAFPAREGTGGGSDVDVGAAALLFRLGCTPDRPEPLQAQPQPPYARARFEPGDAHQSLPVGAEHWQSRPAGREGVSHRTPGHTARVGSSRSTGAQPEQRASRSPRQAAGRDTSPAGARLAAARVRAAQGALAAGRAQRLASERAALVRADARRADARGAHVRARARRLARRAGTAWASGAAERAGGAARPGLGTPTTFARAAADARSLGLPRGSLYRQLLAQIARAPPQQQGPH